MSWTDSIIKQLIETLHDQDLPYTETLAILSTLSGRMPQKLEESVRTVIAKAKSVGHEFPAVRIKKIVEHYVSDHVLPADRTRLRHKLEL